MQAQPMKFLIAVMVVTLAQGGKILIKPFGQCWGSHLLNLEFLAGFLVDKGHEVYFIAPSRYAGPYNPYAKNFKNKVHLIKYTTPEFEMEHSFQSCDTSDSIDNIRKESPTKQLHYRMSHEFSHCKALFMSTGSLKRIKNLKADLVITDSLAVCGSILATYLDIPYVTVDMVPGSHRSVWDLPHTPYLPSVDMPFSDQMTLMERVQNSVSQYFLQPIQNYIFRGYFLNPFRELLEYCNLTDVTLTDLVNHGAAYRIYNTDFSIEYPSPLLPNMAFIGGFFNTGSRPLEKEVTLFLQDVEEKEGLVIVSMGSRTRYDIQWGNLFAKALAQLPCKVIWRHIPDTNDLDDFPSEHGKNTMIVKWLPQRELLSNPKTKLFVTHAGAGSMFEAVYHGLDHSFNC
ncbi:UDP-glucuronosyltransferase 1-9 [Lingula anatina]|uniref:UDP-glucuronosyltransferase 1-9 n=1 Tax=Lingula anatina TaxID=7574 RepID=A0A1S3I3B0_LINAN|nr:UDP-glucuronosyltransferase 1-9 [Lingula anatina]|eukprot:XP_013392321.1 UDP-glucuronosyltransferase 1-9 [Lingula anatina]